MEVKEKPPDNYYKCVKTSLKHALKHQDLNLPKITSSVFRSHKIMIHTLQFMKLYILDHYEKTGQIQEVNRCFVNSCMKILCIKGNKGRPPSKETTDIKAKLTDFYNKEYKKLYADEDLTYTHMNTILDYLVIDILTMYENNIKQHYVEYVEKYVNIVWKKKYLISKIRRVVKGKENIKNHVNKLYTKLRKIKNDLLTVDSDEFKSEEPYHKWIIEHRKLVVPIKKRFEKQSIYYDICCKPWDYFSCMINMMKIVESEGYSVNSVFPLRTNIIPKYIRLDTTTLVNLLIRKEHGNKGDLLTKGNLKRNEDMIWSFFFRTERQCFKKLGYKFHHMIETDGVGCSILFLRDDMVGKRMKPKIFPTKEKYIDELEDYSSLVDKNIVAIDPGKCDILYCVDGTRHSANKFRYSQDQRRKETKAKKYAKIILEQKQRKIGDKSILELETELSKYNHKTLDIVEYKKYISKKNEINSELLKFYEENLFRKLKLNGFINRQKSEQKMLNRFSKIFGSKDEVVVCFGDFEQKKHMKFKEPIKGKGMRTLFRRYGYTVYLVDEFRTSCKCSNCKGGECEKFMVRENPKPFRDNLALVHGLLKCKTCDSVWNRDNNGARNIYRISRYTILGGNRPRYLRRGNLSGVFNDTSKTKFTCPEMDKPCSI